MTTLAEDGPLGGDTMPVDIEKVSDLKAVENDHIGSAFANGEARQGVQKPGH